MFMSNVRLEVADVVTCLRFYHDVFDFELTWGSEDDAGYCSFKVSDQTSLAIHQYENNLDEIGAQVGMRPLPEVVRGRDTALLIAKPRGHDHCWPGRPHRLGHPIVLPARPGWELDRGELSAHPVT